MTTDETTSVRYMVSDVEVALAFELFQPAER
jgi:hypothetical protein